MSSPLISIIIPNYNRANLIGETLNSLVVQTYKNWEAIIIDDGSTDESESIIRDYENRDSRFKYIERNRQPKGASTCRNIGLHNANGEWIIFLDSDDLLASWCLSNRIQFATEKKDSVFFIFPMILFDQNPSDNSLLATFQKNNDFSRFIIMDYPWTITSPLWRKDFLIKIGGFDENYKIGQDWELHMRALITGGNYYWCENCLPDCFYRRHSGERVGVNTTKDNLLNRSEHLSVFYEICHNQSLDHEQDFIYSIYWNSFLPLLRSKEFESAEKVILNNSVFKIQKDLIKYFKFKIKLYRLLNLKANSILEKIIRKAFIFFFIPQIKRQPNYFLKERLDQNNIKILKEKLNTLG